VFKSSKQIQRWVTNTLIRLPIENIYGGHFG
jgi:hypothetical protein